MAARSPSTTPAGTATAPSARVWSRHAGWKPRPQQSAPRALLPPGLHGAAGLASLLPGRKTQELRPALRGCPRNPPRRVPEPAGSHPGHDRGAAHLVPDPCLPPTPTLHRDRWRSRPRRDRWIAVTPRFPGAGARPVQGVSRKATRDSSTRSLRADRRHRSLTRASPAPPGRRQKWVVYSKAPMAGPAQVLRYLGRYTHRIAIGNERLVALQDGRVTFRYRDRRRGNQQQAAHPRSARLRPAFPPPRAAPWFRPRPTLRPSGQWLSRHGSSPEPRQLLGSRLLSATLPAPRNPGKTSFGGSPDAIPTPAPTADAARFASSPRRHPSPTPEAHDPLAPQHNGTAPRPVTLLVRPSSLTTAILQRHSPPSTPPSAHSTAVPAHHAPLRINAQRPPPTTSPKRTIPIRGGTRGLVQHVVSAGASALGKAHDLARAPTETTLFVFFVLLDGHSEARLRRR